MAEGNGNRTLGAFVDSALKLWPLLAFVLTLVGWGISVEMRLPPEVPPEWFQNDVEEIKREVKKVAADVNDLKVEVAKVQTSQTDLVIRLNHDD